MCNIITAPLPVKEYQNLKPHQLRVLLFDPAEVYARINASRVPVDHFKRVQSIPIFYMFPTLDPKICACGCGAELMDKRRRYATEQCTWFVKAVWGIINNWSGVVEVWLRKYFPDWACCGCGVMGVYCEKTGNRLIQIDHIIGVKHGGGGCWLGNYQLLCDVCHPKKTALDFKPKPDPLQVELPLITLEQLSTVF